MADSGKRHPTVTELFELIKRSSIPTVFVEGKDDIIFYRSFEHSLSDLSVDMLPAGNKDAVLELKERLKGVHLRVPVVFVVDKDLWVFPEFAQGEERDALITTNGYSIENDLFQDGGILELMTPPELESFNRELGKFINWYSLAIARRARGADNSFRTHPGKLLDDNAYYDEELTLREGEIHPDELKNRIQENYGILLRGKSLFALIVRQLSANKRAVKFSAKQLMAIGASQKGNSYKRLERDIRAQIELGFGNRKHLAPPAHAESPAAELALQ